MKKAENVVSPIGLREGVFALFLLAGYFKADPRFSIIPVDLTLLTAILVSGFSVHAFVIRRFRIPASLLLVLACFALFVPGLFWIDLHEYAVEKSTRLFSLTLLSAAAPFYLISDQDQVRKFTNALAILGAFMALDAIYLLLTQGGASRLTAYQSNTIALGRALGAVLLWVLINAAERRLNYGLGLVLSGGLALLLISSGSRGPLLATVVGMILTTILFYLRGRQELIRLSLIALVTVTALILGVSLVPQASLMRIESLLSGSLGLSELTRLDAFQLSWIKVLENPFGIGLGGFASQIGLWGSLSRQYPHNIVLEILLEGGWLTGLFFLFLASWAGVRLYRWASYANKTEFRILFSFFVFFLVNALVSGDLNDNRALFACMGAALTLKSWRITNGGSDTGNTLEFRTLGTGRPHSS